MHTRAVDGGAVLGVMDVAIVPHVVAEGMNGHDHAELAGGPVEAAAQNFEQALVGDCCESRPAA